MNIKLKDLKVKDLDKINFNKSIFDIRYIKFITEIYNLNLKVLNIDEVHLPVVEIKTFFKKYLVSLPLIYNIKLDKRIYETIITHRKKLINLLNKNNYNDLIIKSNFDRSDNFKNHFKTLWYDHVLNLEQNIENIKKKFKKNLIRNLTTIENNYYYKTSTSKKDILEYYDHYVIFCKSRGYFSYTKKYFKNLDKYWKINENFLVLNAIEKDNKKKIASIFVWINDNNSQALYISGYNKIKNLPINKYLIYNIIKLLKNRGIKEFYFGRTNIGNLGLKRFKESFGTKTIDLNYFSLMKKDYQSMNNKYYILFTKIFLKIIPMFLYNYINRAIFKKLIIY